LLEGAEFEPSVPRKVTREDTAVRSRRAPFGSDHRVISTRAAGFALRTPRVFPRSCALDDAIEARHRPKSSEARNAGPGPGTIPSNLRRRADRHCRRDRRPMPPRYLNQTCPTVSPQEPTFEAAQTSDRAGSKRPSPRNALFRPTGLGRSPRP
jgi:hypothetical protein